MTKLWKKKLRIAHSLSTAVLSVSKALIVLAFLKGQKLETIPRLTTCDSIFLFKHRWRETSVLRLTYYVDDEILSLP